MTKDFMVKESELDDIQRQVLNQMLDKSCIVTGCAGSGKSVLALQKAKRIQNERGNNYKIIVYTKALCDYMNGGKEQLGLTQRFYYYKEWKWKKILKQYGHKGAFWVYEKDNNGNDILNMPSADYIIVDEIQDFTKEEIQEFINAARKNFFFFGDTSQSIYNGYDNKQTMPVGLIKWILAPQAKDFPLYFNYRLPKPVAKITQDYVGVGVDPYGDGSVYKSTENIIPCIIQYQDLVSQIKAIAKIIRNESLTDVGILVSNNELIPQISVFLNDEGLNHEIRYNDNKDFRNNIDTLDFTTTNPKLMTYHSAKGLQFETVFIPHVADATTDNDRKALYVAMTRTYRSLYIMYSGSLPMPLAKVPGALYQTSVVKNIDDI